LLQAELLILAHISTIHISFGGCGITPDHTWIIDQMRMSLAALLCAKVGPTLTSQRGRLVTALASSDICITKTKSIRFTKTKTETKSFCNLETE